MALKSWSIPDFPGASAENMVEREVLNSDSAVIVSLSLIISNYADMTDAHVTVERRGKFGNVKSRWGIDVAIADSPFALDSKLVFVAGDKLVVTSDNPDVSVDVSGDEELWGLDESLWRKSGQGCEECLGMPDINVNLTID